MNNVRFMYLRNSAGVPEACVAYRVDESFGSGHVSFGLSVHNPADKWDRKVARYMAAGALLLEPTFTFVADNDRTTNAVATAVATLGGFPTRAKKAAKIWLRVAAYNAPDGSNSDLSDIEEAPLTERTHAHSQAV